MYSLGWIGRTWRERASRVGGVEAVEGVGESHGVRRGRRTVRRARGLGVSRIFLSWVGGCSGSFWSL